MKQKITNFTLVLFSTLLIIACINKGKSKENENTEMKIVTTTYNDTIYNENGEMKIVSTTVTDTLYLQKPD
ncbi:MAG: hypothetical protein CVT92_13345 [Bacteroidetes bacterium HGW-Bacteroidetes-1]|jgi:hypothetical protein|nr:MAG: hypothetical protein CVT92_13345 [Bacteroidetes bacterium HGW-Bacteroidetes-1]